MTQNASLATQVQDWHELNGAEPLEANPQSNGHQDRLSIDNYNAQALDAIASIFQGRDDENDAQIKADLKYAKKIAVSIAGACTDDQFDDGIRMCAYEIASGFCYTAWFNGTRLKDKRLKAEAKLAQLRRNFDGTEINDNQLQDAIKDVERLNNRRWFWRMDYTVALEVYRETVAELGFDFLPAKWTPPASKEARAKQKKDRRTTFASAQADYLLHNADQAWARKTAHDETINPEHSE